MKNITVTITEPDKKVKKHSYDVIALGSSDKIKEKVALDFNEKYDSPKAIIEIEDAGNTEKFPMFIRSLSGEALASELFETINRQQSRKKGNK